MCPKRLAILPVICSLLAFLRLSREHRPLSTEWDEVLAKDRSNGRSQQLRSQSVDPRVAWYVGLALMALFEVIDWPVALVIGVGHEIAHRARSQAMRELAEGVEAAG